MSATLPATPVAFWPFAEAFQLIAADVADLRARPSLHWLASFLIRFDGVKRTADESRWMGTLLDGMTLDEHMELSWHIYRHVRAEIELTKELTAVIGLFSGGDDSSTFMHLFLDAIDYAGHVDTTIKVHAAQEHVVRVCEGWGLPLIIERPPEGCTYRDLVLQYGFPGPGQHGLAYRILKERALRRLRARFVADGRHQRVLFLGGMRNHESDRRMKNTQLTHRENSVVWCSPIAWWTDAHLREYRERFDVPRSEVAVHLHMSGECLCGAYAKPGEIHAIEMFYPDDAAEIHALEDEVRAKGLPCVWGVRPPKGTVLKLPKVKAAGPLCAKCEQLSFDEAIA